MRLKPNGTLRIDAPPGVLTEADWSDMAIEKARILTVLAAADVELSKALGRVRWMQQHARKPARVALLEEYAIAARGYRDQMDNLLYEVVAALDLLEARWQQWGREACEPTVSTNEED
jgi:hypothetical protein